MHCQQNIKICCLHVSAFGKSYHQVIKNKKERQSKYNPVEWLYWYYLHVWWWPLTKAEQVQHSHHAEIPIKNSQSHRKCTAVCNKSYSTYRSQHPLRKWRHPWKNQ